MLPLRRAPALVVAEASGYAQRLNQVGLVPDVLGVYLVLEAVLLRDLRDCLVLWLDVLRTLLVFLPVGYLGHRLHQGRSVGFPVVGATDVTHEIRQLRPIGGRVGHCCLLRDEVKLGLPLRVLAGDVAVPRRGHSLDLTILVWPCWPGPLRLGVAHLQVVPGLL